MVKHAGVFAWLIGIAALVGLAVWSGLDAVGHAFSSVGWGILLVVLARAVTVSVAGVGWWLLFPSKLRRGLNQDVDDDAGGGERGADGGAKRQQSRAEEIAADLAQRQEDVGRLPQEPHEDTRLERGTQLRGKQQPPAHSRHRDGDGARQHDEQDAPADAGKRVADRIQA